MQGCAMNEASQALISLEALEMDWQRVYCTHQHHLVWVDIIFLFIEVLQVLSSTWSTKGLVRFEKLFIELSYLERDRARERERGVQIPSSNFQGFVHGGVCFLMYICVSNEWFLYIGFVSVSVLQTTVSCCLTRCYVYLYNAISQCSVFQVSLPFSSQGISDYLTSKSSI